MSESVGLPRIITLGDGRVIELKIAAKEDYSDGRYEFLYSWLGKVDKYLSQKFKPEDIENNKQSWLNNLNNCRITVVGLNEGRIVASATLLINKEGSRVAHTASFGIAVHPDFQNKGLGTILIKSLESIAKKRGVEKMEVNYYDGNPAGVLYRSLHYCYEGRRLKKAKLDDATYVDEVLMYKFI
ncbi:MAG TPA: GNAT family N-acetyltransferase [Candidatus Acidoferrales bacterium]|nr:GNAT family N-acetyltransferase [Candidatus Acidoferrales bacterium]